MKYKHLIAIVFLILLLDQVLKIYIKTNFVMGAAGEVMVFNDWFRLCFIENEGMAFGMKILDNSLGKIILTVFRLCAVTFGFYYLKVLIAKKHAKGLLICAALILAGALGNLIDSIFYGMIFSNSSYSEVAHFTAWGEGYGKLLHGKVVDMFYFPIVQDYPIPEWVPIWGGELFSFFEPIFNIADVAISTGVITILVFQKRYLNKQAFNLKAADTSSVPENSNL